MTSQASNRDPRDVLDRETGKVRVLRRQCETCVFRAEGREIFGTQRVESLVQQNLDANALLTCHSTLPYGPYPNFDPAVCAGFWARHGLETASGRVARLIGLVRPMPPGEG